MKKLFLFLSMSLVAASVSAMPAKRGQWKAIGLADGTEVMAELKGDEFCAYWQTADGRRFVQNPGGSFGQADMARLATAASAMRAASGAGRVSEPAHKLVIGGDHNPYTGTKKGLVILVDFTNKKFGADNTRELFYRIANEEGFSERGFSGSVKDYFKAQSYGSFELDFDVVGPVHMKQRYGYYGAPSSDGMYQDTYGNIAHMISEACKAVDNEVDFNDYDWDGDGEAEQVFVIYAGMGQADGGDVNTIWPHASNIKLLGGEPPVLDGVKINTYACSCELNGKGNVYGIGAMCHEFSHCLGLPDFYDTQGDTYYGTWSYDIMDYGCYNGNAYIPAGYTSYERMYAGWLRPVELAEDCAVTSMKDLNEGEAYAIYNDGNRNEYYLLENRQKTGWDAALDGEGLLILHVDFDANAWGKNVVNSVAGQQMYDVVETHKRCSLIPADNNMTLNLAAIACDTYPNAGNDCLTNTSVPAATLYNKNTDGSYFMNKPVTGITQNADGTVSFLFGKGASGADIVTPDTPDNRIYSIDGRYMGSDMDALRSGVYIVGGKKVVK